MHRRFVALACVLPAVVAVSPLHAQSWFDRDRSFGVQVENDSFGKNGSDSAYTQGLRLAWDFDVWPNWIDAAFPIASFTFKKNAVNACDPRTARSLRPCGVSRLAFGQTMYTPPIITIAALQPTARPYAGYLFGTLGGTMLFERAAVTSELTLGLLGQGALARETQSLAHWTWAEGSAQPLGWHNQLANSWQLTLRNAYSVAAVEYCHNKCTGEAREGRIFDIIPTGELVVGSLMRRASVGGTARVGWGFPDLLTAQRIPTTKGASAPDGSGLSPSARALADIRRGWRSAWIMVFVGGDARLVQHNAMLSGGWRDTGPRGWQTVRQIETERYVPETTYGLGVGVGRANVSWQRVTRGSEYRPNGGTHRFSAFSIAIFAPTR